MKIILTTPYLVATSTIKKLASIIKDGTKPIKTDIHIPSLNFRTSIITSSILGLTLFSAAVNSANNIGQAFQVTAQEKIQTPHKENTLLVKFRSGTTLRRVMTISAMGKGARSKAKVIPGVKMLRLDIPGLNKVAPQNQWQTISYPAGANLAAIIDQLSAVAEVEYVQPDYMYYMSAISSIDPLYTSGELWGIDEVNAPAAWQTTQGASTIVVAVIDSGIDFNHPDLKDNIWTNPNTSEPDVHGWDALDNDYDPSDTHGHGTHVSGIIAAQANSIGVIGVAPKVQILPIRAFGSRGGAPTSVFVAGLEYATSKKVKISNNSWGGQAYDLRLYEAIRDSNMLFVAAAGNSDWDNDKAYEHNSLTAYPASFDLPNIVSVGAIDEDGYGSSFSSFGLSSVDIAAPGRDIWSTASSYIGCKVCSSEVHPGYVMANGTSMASPHVAGAAALLYSQDELISIADAKAILLQSANQSINAGLEHAVSDFILTGRLDIAKAIKAPIVLTSDATVKTVTTAGIVQFTVRAESFNSGSGNYTLDYVIHDSHNRDVDHVSHSPDVADASFSKSTLSVPSGGQDSAVVSLNLGANFRMGKHKVEVIATSATDITESYAISLLINATVDVDLVVTNITTSPAVLKVDSSDTFDASITIANNGSVDATDSFIIAYYISKDSHIDRNDKPVYHDGLSPAPLRQLTAGGTYSESVKLIVPYLEGPEHGAWYFGAIVDYLNTVLETDENNNAFTANNTIDILEQSDLIVTGITTATTNPQPGERFDVTVTVKNSGVTGKTGASDVCWGIYLSDDAEIIPQPITDETGRIVTPSDKGINSGGKICAAGTNSYLAVGATYTRTTTVTIPWNTAEKQYYLGAYVDSYYEVPEVDETNNYNILPAKIAVGTASGGSNQAPTALISGPSSGGVNTLLNFSGSGSSDPDGDSLSYAWSFGDGGSSSGASVVSHAYTTSGTKTVTLTVTDTSGLSDSTTHSVFIVADQKPTAALSGPSTGNVGDSLTFSASGSSDTEGPVSYAWSFGDNTAGDTGVSVSHVYTTTGSFAVQLTVTDSIGQTATASLTVTVSSVTPPPSSSSPYLPPENYHDATQPITQSTYIRILWVGASLPPAGYAFTLRSSSTPDFIRHKMYASNLAWDGTRNAWTMFVFAPNNMPLGSAFIKLIPGFSVDPDFELSETDTFEIVAN